MEAPIPVVCPACGRSGNVPAAYAGKPIRCKQCGDRIVVPTPGSDTPPPPEPPARPRAPAAVAPVRPTPERRRRESADDAGGVFWVGGTAPLPTNPFGMVVTPDRLVFVTGPAYLLTTIIAIGSLLLFCLPVFVVYVIAELLTRKGQRRRWEAFQARDLDALRGCRGVWEIVLTDDVNVDYYPDKATFVVRNGWKWYRLKVAAEDREEAGRAARQLRRYRRRP